MGQSLEKTVCENAKKVLVHLHPGMGILEVSKTTKIGKGTVGRIYQGAAHLSLDLVGQIAKLAKIDPWMLLVPSFEASAPPLLEKAAKVERARLHTFKVLLSENTDAVKYANVQTKEQDEDTKHETVFDLTGGDRDSSAVPQSKKRRRPKKSP